MPPIIHCVRHAQGTHNLSPLNHDHSDPCLTRYGEEQCRNFYRIFPHHSRVQLLVSSPLLRCLQTTLLSFPSCVRRLPPIIAQPLAQETSSSPCDTGRDPDKLRQFLGNRPVDLSLVHEGWNTKQGVYAEDATTVQERARKLREWLRARPEEEIVLVSHGGFLHWFTQEWGGSDGRKDVVSPNVGTGWANCEWRSYEFVGDGDNCGVVETAVSKREREVRAKKLVDSDADMLAAERKAGALGRMKARNGVGDRVKTGITSRIKNREWVGGYF